MSKAAASAPTLDLTLVIQAPPGLVFRGFFDPDALGAWWRASRSLATPRVLGPYVIEWLPTEFSDDVLGRLGGVFTGTVMHVDADVHAFFVAEAYWLPPDGDPIGPMALEVTCAPSDPAGGSTRVRVTQNGFEECPRWRRYYDVTRAGWERALVDLKMLLEK